jgi:hypothetical protein
MCPSGLCVVVHWSVVDVVLLGLCVVFLLCLVYWLCVVVHWSVVDVVLSGLCVVVLLCVVYCLVSD